MPADSTTFFFAFLSVFAGIGWYLWHLERRISRLEATIDKNRPKTGSP